MPTTERAQIGTGGWIYYAGGPDGIHARGRLRFEPRWTPQRYIKAGAEWHRFELGQVRLTTGGECLEYVWREVRRA